MGGVFVGVAFVFAAYLLWKKHCKHKPPLALKTNKAVDLAAGVKEPSMQEPVAAVHLEAELKKAPAIAQSDFAVELEVDEADEVEVGADSSAPAGETVEKDALSPALPPSLSPGTALVATTFIGRLKERLRRASSSMGLSNRNLAIEKPAPEELDLVLEVGTVVEVNFKGRGNWFNGTIKKVNSETGTFTIQYVAGDCERRVARENIRAATAAEKTAFAQKKKQCAAEKKKNAAKPDVGKNKEQWENFLQSEAAQKKKKKKTPMPLA